MAVSEGPLRNRVLLIAYNFPPENIVGALRPARFAKYLRDFSFTPQVLTASVQNSGSIPPNVHYAKDFLREGIGLPMKILRLCENFVMRLYAHGGNSQALTWIPAAVRGSEQQMPFDFMISTSPPVATHLSAIVLKRRHPEVVWLADFRDPLIGNPVHTDRRTRFWARRMELRIFEHADCLIANTDAVAELWRVQYPQWKSKIIHIWNGFDPAESIGPLPIPQQDRKVIAHVGDVYGGRTLRPFLVAMQRLLETEAIDTRSWKVRLIGNVDMQMDSDLIHKLMKQDVLSVSPMVSSSEAARLMGEADSLLLADWVGDSGGLQVPYKLFPYIRVGRPILAIAKKGSPVDRILSKSEIPHTCLYPGDSIEQHAAKLLNFLSLPSTPVKASDWFYREFDGRRQTESLAEILASLTRRIRTSKAGR